MTAARPLAPAGAAEQGHGGHGARDQRGAGVLRHDRRARGGRLRTQRRVRDRPRAQLPAPQARRRRFDRRAARPRARRPGSSCSSAANSPRTCSGSSGWAPTAAEIWNIARWPAAVLVAMLVLLVHLLRHPGRRAAFVALDHAGRGDRRAGCGCSRRGASRHTSRASRTSAPIYGAFAGAIVLRGVDLADERRAAVRRRAQRGDRAREGDARGRPPAGHLEPARAASLSRRRA